MQYHSSWPADAKEYFERAIHAHGGWTAWNAFTSLELKLEKFSGTLVLAKGLHRTFHAPDKLIVIPKKRQVNFVFRNHVDTFENGRITFSSEKKVIEDGRSLFKKTTLEQWYPEHAAYFFGYAWANYTSYPFILPEFELLSCSLSPDVSFFEIKFPDSFHTHCPVQKFYFDHRHMLCRHDYRSELAGPLVYAAHFTTDYVEHQGLRIALIRKVRPRIGKLVLPVNGIYGKTQIALDSR